LSRKQGNVKDSHHRKEIAIAGKDTLVGAGEGYVLYISRSRERRGK
jgi:hypothetical protein